MLLKLYHFPKKHIQIIVPIVVLIALLFGLKVETASLRQTLPLATIVMIYPTMVGVKWKQLLSTKHTGVVGSALFLNFLVIPLIAYLLGSLFLKGQPMMFAGLMLAATIPTSGMTISWTMLNKGNVPLAIQLVVIGLLMGAFLAPWYLHFFVGEMVELEVGKMFRNILLVVVVPMILGGLSTRWLKGKYSEDEFRMKVKPNLAPLSIWGMLYVIFISISMRSRMLLSQPGVLLISLLVLILFYVSLFALGTFWAKRRYSKENGVALVYGTALRNLSICLGIAATSLGGEAAFFLSLATILQQQMVVLYAKWIDARKDKEEPLATA